MQLIEQFYSQPRQRDGLQDGLLLKIQAILHNQSVSFQVTASSPKHLAATIALRPLLTIPRVLSSFWVFSVGDQLQVSAQLLKWEDQATVQITPQTTALLRSLNATSHGLYFLKGNVICFRTRIPWETSKRSLQAQVREAYLQVSQQFGRYAVTAKLVEAPEEAPSRKITDTLQRLRELKEEFQFSRQQRTRSTKCYNLSNSHIKVVSQAIALVNLSFAKLKLYARENKFDLARCHKVYASVRKVVEDTAAKELQRTERTIVRGIEIESISGEEVIDQGGFSLIRRGLYEFQELLTFNYYNPAPSILPTQAEDISKAQQAVEGNKRILVRKQPIQQNDPNFSNQLDLLKFIRNQKCPSIADFYLSSSRKMPLDSSIFIQYYQGNLARLYLQLQQRQLLKVSRQILQGIHFLWQNRILHRDLKELNVLVDQSGNAKLIDFGSASGFYSNTAGQFRSSQTKLMTTKGYFCSYNTIDIPAVTQKFQRDEFHQAETFDMYSFGQILHNLFQLDRAQDGLVERELLFLTRKCQETNPDDRIFPLQALCYFREIITLFAQEATMKTQEEKTETVGSSKRLFNSTSQQ